MDLFGLSRATYYRALGYVEADVMSFEDMRKNPCHNVRGKHLSLTTLFVITYLVDSAAFLLYSGFQKKIFWDCFLLFFTTPLKRLVYSDWESVHLVLTFISGTLPEPLYRI